MKKGLEESWKDPRVVLVAKMQLTAFGPPTASDQTAPKARIARTDHPEQGRHGDHCAVTGPSLLSAPHRFASAGLRQSIFGPRLETTVTSCSQISHRMDDFDFNDDVFDGLDEADLADLERPSKRQKSSHPTPSAPRNPQHLALAEKLLTEKFGYAAFRHEQAGAIQSILAGENALAIFPTGAGKSLCYQIPAIAFPELDRTEGRAPADAGLTIVVSPLIALMKDQVDALQKRGISADSIDSTKSWEQQREIYAKIRNSQLRILYCAPERLNNEGFVVSIRDVPGGIRLLAVDEAHCVSEVRREVALEVGERGLTMLDSGATASGRTT